MKNYSSQNGGGQGSGYRGGRGGRGGRNRHSGGGGNRNSYRGSESTDRDKDGRDSYSPSSSNQSRSGNGYRPSPTPQPKPTFWQKVVGFFTGKRSQTPVQPASVPSNRPARPARTESPAHEARATAAAPAPRVREVRKPELVEVTSPKLYIGNLSFDATESDLFELFNGVGKVRNAEVVSNAYTQKSKGFAFVTMETVDEARRAVTELHDKEYMGRKLVVSGAKTSDVARPNRPAEPAEPAAETQPAATAPDPERADLNA